MDGQICDKKHSERLELLNVIGFNGKVPGGLHVHPQQQHLIYALGCNVIIENIATGEKNFLVGHTDTVTCLAVSSNDGAYIASGQVTHMGFKAPIIIWDFRSCEKYAEFSLQKVKIEALTFSPFSTYLVSVGGKDDGSVVVWDVEKKKAICGQPAQLQSDGDTYCVAFNGEEQFITGGSRTLRVWDLDATNRKITPVEVNMGNLVRECNCIVMTEKYLLCGTSTGDILGIDVGSKNFRFYGPGSNKGPYSKVKNFSKGVTAMAYLGNKKLLVGSGDGEVAELQCHEREKEAWTFEKTKTWRNDALKGNVVAVTSIAIRGCGHQFFVGMSDSSIYRFTLHDFTATVLVKTAHDSMVTDVVFPFGCNDMFVTSQKGSIKVWHMKKGQELVRQEVPNKQCNGLVFTRKGDLIISAWDDGKIRAYAFTRNKDGGRGMKLKFYRSEAHSKGVSAVEVTSDGKTVISGGGEGQVRIWSLTETVDNYDIVLRDSMKEHKGAVTGIRVGHRDTLCVSSSKDGTSIVWNLLLNIRQQIVFANSLFKSVVLNENDTQIVTTGSDRKIAFWNVMDGSLIREVQAGDNSINALDTCCTTDSYLLSAGDDKLVKLWKYKEGTVTHIGEGHSAAIQKIKFCPLKKYAVSVSEDGGILIWKLPCNL